MKYFSKTGNISVMLSQSKTAPSRSHNGAVKIVNVPVIFSDGPITKPLVKNGSEAREEFTKEQEKTFYKKVFKTSLAG